MRVVEPSKRRFAIVIVAAVIAAVGVGCASQSDTEPAASAEQNADEFNCELALLRLEKLIDARSGDSSFSVAALIEAREIYELGRELYLHRDYELALQLIEEGIQLLE